MRLWSVHPSRLDQQGLGGLWREGLGAQKALAQWVRGEPGGYQNHPQLDRFKAHEDPLAAIVFYMVKVHEHANAKVEDGGRGFKYNYNLILPVDYLHVSSIPVNAGQVSYELAWLESKMEVRAPHEVHERIRGEGPLLHDSFHIVEGERESWEKGPDLTPED